MRDDVADEGPIVLFDGVCNLCAGFVQFIVPRDSDGVFRFASLQSAVARELLAERGLADHDLDSIVLIEGEDAYVKSDAVLRIADRLGGVYALARPLGLLPRRLRDWGYDVVAANRYRIFGRKEQCMLPTGDVRERFLEGADAGSESGTESTSATESDSGAESGSEPETETEFESDR